jgi:glycosyltransferase involved in cell wall biosynthesis
LDIFAYPTSGESVGWVILEAMAAGKAIVSTAVGSVPTLITHAFNGFLTQSTEAIELVDYVLTLMDSQDLRSSMGLRSRERAIREFSWDGFVQAYYSLCVKQARAVTLVHLLKFQVQTRRFYQICSFRQCLGIIFKCFFCECF